MDNFLGPICGNWLRLKCGDVTMIIIIIKNKKPLNKIQNQKDQRCLMKMFFTLQFIASTSICYEKILLQPCLAKSLWKSLCFYVKYESALEAPVTIGNFF